MTVLAESEGYWPELIAILRDGRIAGPQVHDARVAALCRLHGVRELWTADRDFGRFSGLAVRNPLVGNKQLRLIQLALFITVSVAEGTKRDGSPKFLRASSASCEFLQYSTGLAHQAKSDMVRPRIRFTFPPAARDVSRAILVGAEE